MAISSQDDLFHSMDPSTNTSDTIVETVGGKVLPEVELEPTTPGTLVQCSDHLSYPAGPVLTNTYKFYNILAAFD